MNVDTIPAPVPPAPTAVEVAEERSHHSYSPSTLQNLEACPCYRSKTEAHVAAIKGTIQHAVTETGEDDERLTDDELAAAAECMDFYERKRAEAAARATAAGSVIQEFTEIYLPVDDCKFSDLVEVEVDGQKMRKLVTVDHTTAGYVDRGFVEWDEKSADLFDWKFGAWAVEQADNNLQGIAYSLGMFRKFPKLEKVTFWFKQPQLNYITSAVFTKNDIPQIYLRIQTVVARAREARKMVLDGNWNMARPFAPACNFCALLGKCEKVMDFACKVGSKFHPLAIPSDINPTGLKSAIDMSLGLTLASVMGVWAKAFRTQIGNRVIAGQTPLPEGYKIQVNNGKRGIVNLDKFKEVCLRYMTHEELTAAAQFDFGPVEDIINAKAPRGNKEATVKQFQKELEESGAVGRGNPFSFLKAVSKAKSE